MEANWRSIFERFQSRRMDWSI